MQVLVLGGTRFIGRAIVDALLPDCDVTVLNRGSRNLWDSAVGQVVADRDRPVDTAVLAGRLFDVVVDVSGTTPAHVENVLNVIPNRSVTRYVFISSASVYNRSASNPPFIESDLADGDVVTWGEYGTDKAECESLLEVSDLGELTVLRPPYVYGPRNSEPREQFIWARILSNRPVYVPGPEPVEIQFCHAGHLGAVVRAACTGQLPPDTYNVGGRESHTFEQYVDLLGAVAGKVPEKVIVSDQSVRPREYFPFRKADLTLDVSKIAGTGAVLEGPDLATGMAEALDWFRESGEIVYKPTDLERLWQRTGP
jgi:2'-hydroxyisoflavone reductase